MKQTDISVHQSVGMCVFRSTHLARHNLFIDLDGLIGKKRRVTSSHFVDKNSECPPVHSFVVALKRATERHRITMNLDYCWLVTFTFSGLLVT